MVCNWRIRCATVTDYKICVNSHRNPANRSVPIFNGQNVQRTDWSLRLQWKISTDRKGDLHPIATVCRSPWSRSLSGARHIQAWTIRCEIAARAQREGVIFAIRQRTAHLLGWALSTFPTCTDHTNWTADSLRPHFDSRSTLSNRPGQNSCDAYDSAIHDIRECHDECTTSASTWRTSYTN